MPVNLSEETQRLLEAAEKAARIYNASKVQTSHLLLALIVDKGRVGEVLKSVGVKAELGIVAELARILQRKGAPVPVSMPLSEGVENVLRCAAEETYSWRHCEVGNVHVLQCLLGIYEPEDPAFKMLLDFGVDHTALKRKVGVLLKMLPRESSKKPAAREEMELPELTFESFTEPAQTARSESSGVAAKSGESKSRESKPVESSYTVESPPNVPASSQAEPSLIPEQGTSSQQSDESFVEAPDFKNWMVETELPTPGVKRRDTPTLIAQFFAPEAQSIIERARQMADRNFAPSVGVHHILLAIFDIQGTNVHNILNRYFHTKKMQAVLQELPPGIPEVPDGYFTQEAVSFLDFCWQVVSAWKFAKITTDIMLLRLIDECNRDFLRDFVILKTVGPIPDEVFVLVLKEILDLYPDIEGGLPTQFLKQQLASETGGTYGNWPWKTTDSAHPRPDLDVSARVDRFPRPAREIREQSRTVHTADVLYKYTGQVEQQASPPNYVLNELDESSAWLQGAKYEAARLNAPLIGVQHLLLSILVGQHSEVSSFLRAYVYADRLRMALELVIQDRADPENLKQSRFTIAAHKVLEKAYASSLALSRKCIAPEDLLWAILDNAPLSSIGGIIDGCSGSNGEELKNRVGQQLFGGYPAGAPAEPQTPGSEQLTAGPWSGSWVSATQEKVDHDQAAASNCFQSRFEQIARSVYSRMGQSLVIPQEQPGSTTAEPAQNPPPAVGEPVIQNELTPGHRLFLRGLRESEPPSRKDFRKPKTAKKLISDWFAKDVADILRFAERIASDEGTCIDFSHLFKAILLADDDARTRKIFGKLVVFETLLAALKNVEVQTESGGNAFSTGMLVAMEEAWKDARQLGFVTGEHLLFGILTVLASSDSDIRGAVETAGNAKVDVLRSRLLMLSEQSKSAQGREAREAREAQEPSAGDMPPAMTKLAKSYVDLSTGPAIPESVNQQLPSMAVTANVLDVLCDALDTAKECKHLTATAYHVACALLVKALGEQLNVSWISCDNIRAIQTYLLNQTDVKTDLEDLSGSVPRFGPDVRALMNGAHKEAQRGFNRIVDVQHIGLALLEWKEVSEAFDQHGMKPAAIKRALENCLNWNRARPMAAEDVGFPLDLDVLEDLYMEENLGPDAKSQHDDYIKRLSSRSRYVLRSAGKASELFGNHEVAIEHVLLGLLRERECVAADVLSSQGIDFHEVLTKYMAVCSKGCKRHSSPQKLSSKSHRILKTAWKFAQEFKQVLVEPEHILLSILQEHEGIAFLAWNCLNLSAQETKKLLLSRLRES